MSLGRWVAVSLGTKGCCYNGQSTAAFAGFQLASGPALYDRGVTHCIQVHTGVVYSLDGVVIEGRLSQPC